MNYKQKVRLSVKRLYVSALWIILLCRMQLQEFQVCTLLLNSN